MKRTIMLLVIFMLLPAVCFGGKAVLSSYVVDDDGVYRNDIVFLPHYRGDIVFADNQTRFHTINQLSQDGVFCSINGHWWEAGTCRLCDEEHEVKSDNGTISYPVRYDSYIGVQINANEYAGEQFQILTIKEVEKIRADIKALQERVCSKVYEHTR